MQVKLERLTCSYDDSGSGSPAVILLHGFPLNRTMWKAQVKSLSGKYRIIAPDFRGHGQTPPTRDVSTMENLAKDAACLLDSLQISSAVVGGLSMGGYVALAFWRLFPQRVKALLLLDTKSEADTDEGKEARFQMANLAEEKGQEAVTSLLIDKVLGTTTKHLREALVEEIRTMMCATSVEGLRNALLGMAVRADATPLLATISCPTLVLVGEEDILTPVESARRMADEIPLAKLKIIPRAGHVSPMENPAAVTSALKAFLSHLA